MSPASWLWLAIAVGADEPAAKPAPSPAATGAVVNKDAAAPAKDTAPAKDAAPAKTGRFQKRGGATAKPADKPAPPPIDEKRPAPPEPKKADGDGDPLDQVKTPATEEENPLEKVGRDMRSVEDRLAKIDVSEDTRKEQQVVVDELQKLLDQCRQRDNQQSQSKGGGSSKSQKSQKQRRMMAERESRAAREQAEGKAGGKSAAAAQAQAGQQAGKGPSRGDAGNPKPANTETRKDVWGHLADAMRKEMDQFAKETYLPEYRDLLEKYYESIAERAKKEKRR